MIKKKDPIMLFVFMCLLKQADTWSSVFIDNVNFQTKQRFTHWSGANKLLLRELSPHIDMEWVEENSQVFSDMLHFLASDTEPEKKFQLIGALKAFMNGDVKIEGDNIVAEIKN